MALIDLDKVMEEQAARDKERYEKLVTEGAIPYEPPPVRRKILRTTPEFLGWIGSGRFEVTANPLPKDARIVGSFYDPERNQFGVVFESDEFAEIPYGGVLPELPPIHFRRIVD